MWTFVNSAAKGIEPIVIFVLFVFFKKRINKTEKRKS